MARPILESDDIPAEKELKCPICHDIAVEPVVTPCGHLFCRYCISKSLKRRSVCPFDEFPFNVDDLQQLNGPLRRIYASLRVRCSVCPWKGAMDNFPTHEPCYLRLQFERRIEGLETAHAKELSLQRKKIERELMPFLMVSSALHCLVKSGCFSYKACNRRLSLCS
jgi:Zinc finger, C3HC4 type (RING finger)